ncbi:transmembrane protein 106A [Podarcis raffonei]|uniref:transmembrane protein 106A n=1 Tax=Podarcis raffonei TaxID=65483 RepID=UPI002329635F|nr:transmembrane protein 106A [Podarcis raffonei]XP_053217699.1 transmembrane protein 106A [Podarcis raffonei]XP_053217701.1 transmembrane protein 106A [Podarcis raffonei]XP_053217702.1 transmembrane protein 106A [Podarcis raffonei]XP_053217703.1 transmembrane protein 106A [Podarcis raffonei]XP_053217704.1 transmembrane protein 106A [Podarcis raffonei]
MDRVLSWLRKLCGKEEAEEEKGERDSLREKSSGDEDEAPYYGTINGGNVAEASCAPCVGAASRGSVTCPTCQGTGRIPREQEQQLVALIPYGDQRLKPRRTKLYVCLTVAICLLMTGLMMYFLFPRSIAVVPAGLNFSSISFDNSTYSITLNMTNMLNVTNNNFYTVHVSQLALEVLHKALVIGKNTVTTQLDIRPLHGAQMHYSVSSKIMDNNTYNICTWSKIKVHNVLLHIQGTVTCSYLAHSEQLAFENYQYVDCRGNVMLPGMSGSSCSP